MCIRDSGLISRTPAGWELAEDLDAAMTAAAAALGLTGRADEVAAQHRRCLLYTSRCV